MGPPLWEKWAIRVGEFPGKITEMRKDNWKFACCDAFEPKRIRAAALVSGTGNYKSTQPRLRKLSFPPHPTQTKCYEIISSSRFIRIHPHRVLTAFKATYENFTWANWKTNAFESLSTTPTIKASQIGLFVCDMLSGRLLTSGFNELPFVEWTTDELNGKSHNKMKTRALMEFIEKCHAIFRRNKWALVRRQWLCVFLKSINFVGDRTSYCCVKCEGRLSVCYFRRTIPISGNCFGFPGFWGESKEFIFGFWASFCQENLSKVKTDLNQKLVQATSTSLLIDPFMKNESKSNKHHPHLW